MNSFNPKYFSKEIIDDKVTIWLWFDGANLLVNLIEVIFEISFVFFYLFQILALFVKLNATNKISFTLSLRSKSSLLLLWSKSVYHLFCSCNRLLLSHRWVFMLIVVENEELLLIVICLFNKNTWFFFIFCFFIKISFIALFFVFLSCLNSIIRSNFIFLISSTSC